ncbi:Asp-tRNA(Asn)/Glu-tRNA(Gln) amidotransferase subunit GatC [Rickettsiales bacterium]|nr:Asp-tRNA(Asn)/Glu-tRNA(Gln) amidotransferase subunit GatC [Rickettsiales bacterium]
MSIDNTVVKKIANLSKIKLSEKEEESFKDELNNILNWVDDLKKVDTDNVEPMLSVFNESINSREDESKPTNSEQVLSNAPEQKEGFFVVPKVIE